VPHFHNTLFPEWERQSATQGELFRPTNTAGNAIRLAYLCHAQTKEMRPGDILVFYRSKDEQAVTSIGVVESYTTLCDADSIASLVKRRTVYSMDEIRGMARKPTRVMLFRLIRHLRQPLNLESLLKNAVIRGAPQSITKISNDAFEQLLAHDK
jgi:hypothetical protein